MMEHAAQTLTPVREAARISPYSPRCRLPGIEELVDKPEDPLCHLSQRFTDPDNYKLLNLSEGLYKDAFEQAEQYWVEMCGSLGWEYVMCSAFQLRRILTSPEEWTSTLCALADLTKLTIGNGSHQFIGDVVPALVDCGIVRNMDELLVGSRIAVEKLNRYNCGANVFADLAHVLRTGTFDSLEALRDLDPGSGWPGIEQRAR